MLLGMLLGCAEAENEDEPITNEEVFATCEFESLCPNAIDQGDMPGDPATLANEICVYEALRDRTPGVVVLMDTRFEVNRSVVEVFIGADGRVLRWLRSEAANAVDEVILLPPVYFDNCIAQGDQNGCMDGFWFEDEFMAVEASCLDPG